LHSNARNAHPGEPNGAAYVATAALDAKACDTAPPPPLSFGGEALLAGVVVAP
jgi:hypothetical protein